MAGETEQEREREGMAGEEKRERERRRVVSKTSEVEWEKRDTERGRRQEKGK